MKAGIAKRREHAQVVQDRAASNYKTALDQFAKKLFGRISDALYDILGYEPLSKADDKVDQALKASIIDRLVKAFQAMEDEWLRFSSTLGLMMLTLGAEDASINELDLDTVLGAPDEAAIQAHGSRMVESMRNTLYIGDKDSYLQTIRDTIDKGIEQDWTVPKLAIELRRTLDPGRANFSDYMWERIARTETVTFIQQGRLDAYESFGLEKVQRIVSPDSKDDLCVPFADQVYTLAEAEDVIPAHPNCKCAFVPYFEG